MNKLSMKSLLMKVKQEEKEKKLNSSVQSTTTNSMSTNPALLNNSNNDPSTLMQNGAENDPLQNSSATKPLQHQLPPSSSLPLPTIHNTHNIPVLSNEYQLKINELTIEEVEQWLISTHPETVSQCKSISNHPHNTSNDQLHNNLQINQPPQHFDLTPTLPHQFPPPLSSSSTCSRPLPNPLLNYQQPSNATSNTKQQNPLPNLNPNSSSSPTPATPTHSLNNLPKDALVHRDYVYIPNWLTPTFELSILVIINSYSDSQWVKVAKRHLMVFGGEVGTENEGLRHFEESPQWIRQLYTMIASYGIDFPALVHNTDDTSTNTDQNNPKTEENNELSSTNNVPTSNSSQSIQRVANHALLNYYSNGDGIFPHTDGPAYCPAAIILSFLSPLSLSYWDSVPQSSYDQTRFLRLYEEQYQQWELKQHPNQTNSDNIDLESSQQHPLQPINLSSSPPKSTTKKVHSCKSISRFLLEPRSLFIMRNDFYNAKLHGIEPVEFELIQRVSSNIDELDHETDVDCGKHVNTEKIQDVRQIISHQEFKGYVDAMLGFDDNSEQKNEGSQQNEKNKEIDEFEKYFLNQSYLDDKSKTMIGMYQYAKKHGCYILKRSTRLSLTIRRLDHGEGVE